MLFTSIIFPFYLAAVLVVYYSLNHKNQNRWLLFVSYFFYGWWDWRFCSLLAFSTTLDWFVSHALHKSNDSKKRKFFLSLSLVGNLGVLGFFKYFNFFISSFQQLFQSVGYNNDLYTTSIILPVGISFYTFQTMAYTIDVYRREQIPANDFTTFALYVSFFPQLVAGPIERAKRLLPQLMLRRDFNYSVIKSGIPLILFGYFKKVVIADSMSPIVESCFNNYDLVSGPDLLFGTYAFAIQIYCDFSGYTDIARGISIFLGINLINNFSAPYFSLNITEFWRRWHISLSFWLRDYLYISLGGNRRGRLRTYLNLMLTMILGGLWHGAAWTFVFWGMLHGFYLSLHKFIIESKILDFDIWSNKIGSVIRDCFKIIFTFHIVCFSWIFFRSPTLDLAINYIVGILSNVGDLSIFKPVFIGGLSIILIDIGQRKSENFLWLNEMPIFLRYIIGSSLLISSILVFGWHYGTPTPFIYFQF